MHERFNSSPAYAQKVRQRIKAAGITKRLEDHVVGKVQMSASQVQAALGLLKKVVPDLSATEINADVKHRMSWAEVLDGIGRGNGT